MSHLRDPSEDVRMRADGSAGTTFSSKTETVYLWDSLTGSILQLHRGSPRLPLTSQAPTELRSPPSPSCTFPCSLSSSSKVLASTQTKNQALTTTIR